MNEGKWRWMKMNEDEWRWMNINEDRWRWIEMNEDEWSMKMKVNEDEWKWMKMKEDKMKVNEDECKVIYSLWDEWGKRMNEDDMKKVGKFSGGDVSCNVLTIERWNNQSI